VRTIDLSILKLRERTDVLIFKVILEKFQGVKAIAGVQSFDLLG